MAQRRYWPTLDELMHKVAVYWSRYGSRIPSALHTAIDASMIVVEAASEALRLYDALNIGGDPAGTI